MLFKPLRQDEAKSLVEIASYGDLELYLGSIRLSYRNPLISLKNGKGRL